MAKEDGAIPHREDSGFLVEEGPIFGEGLDQAIGHQLQLSRLCFCGRQWVVSPSNTDEKQDLSSQNLLS